MNCTVADAERLLSGSVLGSLGAYTPCSTAPGLKYCLAGYVNLSETVQYVGLCVRDNCTSTSVGELATNLLQEVHAAGFTGITVPVGRAAMVYCTGFAPAWSDIQVVALLLLVLACLVILAASLLDYCNCYAEVSGTRVTLRGTVATQQQQQTVSPAPPLDGPPMSRYTTQDPDGGDFLRGESVYESVGSARVYRTADKLTPQQSPTEAGVPRTPGRDVDNESGRLLAAGDGNSFGGLPPPASPTPRPVSAPGFWKQFEEVPLRRRILFTLIDALSVPRNFARWRLWERGASLNVLTALRSICLAWVVACTTMQQIRIIPGVAGDYNEQNPFNSIVYDDTLAVATFLFLGGYAAQDALAESSHFGPRPLHPPTYGHTAAAYLSSLVRRWGRIMPLYVSVILLGHPVMSRLGSGPYWEAFVRDPSVSSNCRDYWWTNVFFINNVYPPRASQRCFPWAYYFALDFQFFAISPLITLLYFRAPAKAFYALNAIAVVASLIAIGVQSRGYGIQAYATEPQHMIMPFLAGSLLCLTCREIDARKFTEFVVQDPSLQAVLQMSGGFGPDGVVADVGRVAAPITDRLKTWLEQKRIRAAAIWCGLTLQVGVIVAQWSAHVFGAGHGATSAVRVLRQPLWLLGLTASILPMLFGYGGWVRRFFVHRVWVGASRLVFAAYLFAPLVAAFVNTSASSPLRNDFFQLFYVVWGNLCSTLVIALVFHLVIERPMISLLGYDASARPEAIAEGPPTTDGGRRAPVRGGFAES